VGTFDVGYEPVPLQSLELPEERTALVVRPFADERPAKRKPSGGDYRLCSVPLLPYCRVEFERLDEILRDLAMEMELLDEKGPAILGPMPRAPRNSEYGYPWSMARAVAEDLSKSGLFERVEYVDKNAGSGAPLELRGRLLDTRLRHTIYSYGLGFIALPLWVLPLPTGSAEGQVALELELFEPSGGRSLWRHRLEETVYAVLYADQGGLTYGRKGGAEFALPQLPQTDGVPPRSFFSWHFAALRKGMVQAKKDLAVALAAMESR